MSEQTFTHKDLAERLGVSETTVKSYRRKFPGCIPVANQGKPIRFSSMSALVSMRIRDLFETGMSVPEVRERLSKEFDWISPEAPPGETPLAVSPVLGPEITQGVSNMAKGMVDMANQQKAILTRMRGIENMLEELGLSAAVDGEGMRSKSVKAAEERQAILEERLDSLDGATAGLADSVGQLATELQRFLGQRETASRRYREAAQENSNVSPGDTQTTPPKVELNLTQGATLDPAKAYKANVVPLRANVNSDLPPINSPAEELEIEQPVQQEPPRQFFSLPLVVRTGQGQYVNAGGMGMGRFSLNDMKAKLVYSQASAQSFSFIFESHGQGWRLHIDFAASEQNILLVLMEMPTQKSGNVVEVLQVKYNGENVHPTELCGVIEGLRDES